MKYRKPFINVITEDLGGDGLHSNTYTVADVFHTNRVKVGERFFYSQLCDLAKRGVDFEILDEYNDYEYE
ncbi:hypothetical protein EBR43_08905 [bacterium]|nr:hypothetical protein [bacterium]